MPIIKGSKHFQDSNLDDNIFSYLKPEVRQIIFSKKKNTDGLHLIFLPGYKEDLNGQGVWYKKIQVRDNFGGDEIKKKYVVKNLNDDPATYFERTFKVRYPEEAEPKMNDNGFKIYPGYGRLTKRVVFNVALLKELLEGLPVDRVVHVLDLPSYNGADQLTKWMSQPDPEGNPNPLINDPEAAVPVFVKLGTGLNPWMISPNPSHRYEIPEIYGDSEVLYNLDEVFIEKTNEEILADLRGMFSGPVFDVCLEGFVGLTHGAVPGNSFTNSEPRSQNFPSLHTVTKIPAPSGTVTPALTVHKLPPVPELEEEDVEIDIPVAAKKMSNADLKTFLKSKR